MTRRPAHPGLYDIEDAEPILHGSRCASCGATYFPPLTIGCERCGASGEHLAPAPLDARGTIATTATVHLHGGKDITVPFSVAEVQLEGGPLIRVTLADDVVDSDAVGKPVAAQWFARPSDDGIEVVEPRFAVVDR